MSDNGREVVAGGGGEVLAGGDMPPDMSNRSLDAAGGAAGGATGLLGADGFAAVTNEKSRPFDEVDWVRCCCGLGGALEGACVSKNPPPLNGGEATWGAAGVDFVLERLPRLENAEGFACCFWGGGEVVEGKLRPLKASVRPCDWDCGCGDVRLPKDEFLSCCAGGDCGLGAEA